MLGCRTYGAGSCARGRQGNVGWGCFALSGGLHFQVRVVTCLLAMGCRVCVVCGLDEGTKTLYLASLILIDIGTRCIYSNLG